jgi:hypothetical protein
VVVKVVSMRLTVLRLGAYRHLLDLDHVLLTVHLHALRLGVHRYLQGLGSMLLLFLLVAWGEVALVVEDLVVDRMAEDMVVVRMAEAQVVDRMVEDLMEVQGEVVVVVLVVGQVILVPSHLIKTTTSQASVAKTTRQGTCL